MCKRGSVRPIPVAAPRVQHEVSWASRLVTLAMGAAGLASIAAAFALHGRDVGALPTQPIAASRPLAPSAAEPPPASATSQQPDAKQAEQLARETAEQDRRRTEMLEAERKQRAVRNARSSVVIVVYSTTWCPSCKAARDYMSAQGIAYTEIDIEQSESAKLIMRRLNPRRSVPTIDIDGDVMVGFSPAGLEARIDQAAEKRALRL